jgi:hypothetical protein
MGAIRQATAWTSLVTTANTLEDGEAEHAATWAAHLAERFVGTEPDAR